MSRLGLSGIKMITFDATGTLIKFRQPVYQTYAEFAERNSVRVDESAVKTAFKQHWKSMNENEPHFGRDWQEWWSKLVVNVLQSANPSADTKVCKSIAENLIGHYALPQAWEVVPGVDELLVTLREDRTGMRRKWDKPGKFQFIANMVDIGNAINLPFVRLGIVSNFDPRLRQILKGLHLQEKFDFCVLSHEIQSSKPQSGIFWAAVNQCQEMFREFDLDTDCEATDVLHIGNSYINDYCGATKIMFNAALVLTPEQELEEIPEVVRNDPKQNIPVFKDIFELNKFFQDNLYEITLGN